MVVAKTKAGEEVTLNIRVVITLAVILCGIASASGIMAYRLGQVEDRLAALEAKVDSLAEAKGEFGAIKETVRLRTRDRWKKADDLHHMTELCRENGLKMVPHTCITTD